MADDDKDLSQTLAKKNPGPSGGVTGIGGAARRNTIDERVDQAVSGKKKKTNNLPPPPTNAAESAAAAEGVGVVRQFIDRIMGN